MLFRSLKALSLTQFKNYSSFQLSFKKKFVAFTGKNGVGKTNLLDAIYYLCFGKGYFQNVELNNVLHEELFFRLEGRFEKLNKESTVVATYEKGGQKRLLVNNVSYNRLSEHLGQFPVTMIAPNDGDLITGSAENRRRFLDITLSQTNSRYVIDLVKYNKLLSQRNKLLKQMVIDDALLDTYDQQIIALAQRLYTIRNAFANEIREELEAYYHLFSTGAEKLGLDYKSQVSDVAFPQHYRAAQQKDRILGRTQFGVHRDDLLLTLDNQKVRNFGSQGQQKSFLLALKLIQHKYLKEKLGETPILLLDDLFDKLDAQRIENLLNFLTNLENVHVFITHTHHKRIKEALENVNAPFEIFNLDVENYAAGEEE